MNDYSSSQRPKNGVSDVYVLCFHVLKFDSIFYFKAGRKKTKAHSNSRSNAQPIIPLKEAHETNRSYTAVVQTGPKVAEVSVKDSTTILLDAVDEYKSNIRQPIGKATTDFSRNNASPPIGYVMRGAVGSSLDEYEAKQCMADNIQQQNQIRSRLTLPHLTNYQPVSLHMPCGKPESPKKLPAISDHTANVDNRESHSLEISPSSSPGKPKRQNPSMPFQPISIHIRQPSYKSTVHSKLTAAINHLVLQISSNIVTFF